MAKGPLVGKPAGGRTTNSAPVSRMEETTPGGRVMTEGAGFFSNPFGLSSLDMGNGTLDAITLWQVVSIHSLGRP